MAISSLRLRRALSLSSLLLKPLSSQTASIFRSSEQYATISPSSFGSWIGPTRAIRATQFLGFRSSAGLFDRRSIEDDRKIDPDEILFEGCDYNHWLITMEFPKDPKPTPEEMVETYVQTCAKVVGSVEEAKKRIYACSTTTYNGFQAVMTEEMSEKFRGLPGVVFILPDSYIDPVNKEYGGDKYDNGVITPRPPPVQYGRQGRYGDRNRNYDRPRFDRQGPPPERRGYGPPGQGAGPGYGGGYQQQGTGQHTQGFQGPPPPPPPPGGWDGRNQSHQGPPPPPGSWDNRNQSYQGPPSPPGGNWDGRTQSRQGPPPPPGGNWDGRSQNQQGPPSPPGGNWDGRSQSHQGPPSPGSNWDGRNQGYQGPPSPPGGNWDGRNQGYHGAPAPPPPPPPGGNWDGRN